MTTYRGTPDGAGRRVAVVASRFNEMVVRKLVDGALAGLGKAGVADEDVDVVWVPGAFELPLAARTLASGGAYHAVVCLGAVIRGETDHHEHVAAAAARGVLEAGLAAGVPVMFGVLTTDTLDQAMDRAGGRHGNRGWDAALAAMEMVSVMEQASSGGGAS
ncbi:MAG: 6,7-dimethyl-8-ribityllumazine synthase [Actinobacteria bacterium]|nr:6,7-dimethyl-8-ribityllumazine synthase [Actinomycetota bacterium]